MPQPPETHELPRTSAAAVGISDLLDRASKPRSGDKYIRADGRAEIEIVKVTRTNVSWEYVDDHGAESYTTGKEQFCRLAKKTIDFGAKFIPWSNAPGEPPARENTKL